VEICADWQFVANVTIQLDFYIYQLQSFKVSFSNYSCASRKGIILFGCCVVEESQKNCWLRVAVVKARRFPATPDLCVDKQSTTN
jgi:hypothetical protein